MRSMQCVDLSWVCMPLRLFAVARVSYPEGMGCIKTYWCYDQVSFASHCREQAKEDIMLCIYSKCSVSFSNRSIYFLTSGLS